MRLFGTGIPGQPRIMSAKEVSERLKENREGLILLDVRTPGEWAYDGRIEGATLIPIEEIQARAAHELPQDAEIIVYCHLGARSQAVASYLLRLGYSRVADLRGGIDAWERAGLPVVRGE